jgi:tRNA(Ile)-lysidine synthase
MLKREKAFFATVEAAIWRHHMLASGDAVVVGVSGGPDSVALLHCLVAFRRKWSLRLVVAHLNHQLRGETADQEAAFVERLASILGLPCDINSRDVASYGAEHRLSIQEAAREVRYAFYDEVATRHGAGKIALGHQANDNAESILIHLLRGTGPKGLTGIPPVRDGRIIRPLIDSNRSQILDFLEERGFEYVRDRSNLDPKYLRTRIRHELLPFLKESFNPGVVHALTRLASIVRQEEDFFNGQVKSAFQDLVREQKTNRLTLSAAGLARLHPALLQRLVRQAVLSIRGDLKRLGHNHVEAIVSLARGALPSGRLDLPHGVQVVRDRDDVTFSVGAPESRPRFEYHVAGPGTTLIQEIGTCLRLSVCDADGVAVISKHPPTTAFLDLQEVPFPVTVRSIRRGDRFRPLGMSGSQKLKAFFINHKVPRSQRHRCPLLLSGEKIVWVGGYRIDDSAKVTEKTKRVLRAELWPAR